MQVRLLFYLLPALMALSNFEALADDVPTNVMARIKAQAKASRPSNAETEQHLIQQEADAYTAVQSYAADDVPPAVIVKLTSKAAKLFPGNYNGQLNFLQKETKAYLDLVQFPTNGIPQKTLAEIRKRAASTYPDSFVDQLKTVGQQADACRQHSPSVEEPSTEN